MWRGEIDGGVMPDGTGDQRQGYRVVEVGNADLAQDLRKQFDVPKPVSVDLATTIVPVVAVDLSDADGSGSSEHPFIAATDITPVNFGIGSIENRGSGIVVVEKIKALHPGDIRLWFNFGRVNINSSTAGVLFYTNTTPAQPGCTVLQENATGGLVAPYFTLEIATTNAAPRDWITLGDGLVLHPGMYMSVWGATNAVRFAAVFAGREFDG